MPGSGEKTGIHSKSPENERPTHRTGGWKQEEFSAASVAMWERIQKRAEGKRLEKKLNTLANDNPDKSKKTFSKTVLSIALILCCGALASFSKPAATNVTAEHTNEYELSELMDTDEAAVAAILNSISVGE